MSYQDVRGFYQEPDDDIQPAYRCDHCLKPAKGAVAITLRPWSLSDTNASAGWLCGTCADELRVWLGDEAAPSKSCFGTRGIVGAFIVLGSLVLFWIGRSRDNLRVCASSIRVALLGLIIVKWGTWRGRRKGNKE